MARSTYVYTVQSLHSGGAGAFTVKHELVSWLNKKTPAEYDVLRIHRVRDGFPDVQPVPISVYDLLSRN